MNETIPPPQVVTTSPTTLQPPSTTLQKNASGTIDKQVQKADSTSTVVEQQLSKKPTLKRRMIGRFELQHTIGEGSSGKVRLAIHKDTLERVF